MLRNGGGILFPSIILSRALHVKIHIYSATLDENLMQIRRKRFIVDLCKFLQILPQFLPRNSPKNYIYPHIIKVSQRSIKMFLQRGIKKNIYREIVIIVFFQSFQRRVKFNSKKERERDRSKNP